MCVIRVRGSINYINILLKSQGRVYKDPKRGRMHISISLPPMEIYLVAAEQWGPLQCSISWHKQLKLYRASECFAENLTWFFFCFYKLEQTLKLQAILSSVIAAFVLSEYFCSSHRSLQHIYFFCLILHRNSKGKHTFSLVLLSIFLTQVIRHSWPPSLHFIWTPEGLIGARCRRKTI